MIKMYGIPNCDTVKKARTFLEKKKIDFEFVDFKKTPPEESDIERWKKAFGEWPLNKKGPTFRKNKEEFEKLSQAKRTGFIILNSSMIKRPILEIEGEVFAFGFNEETYKTL
jgi:arsenate reductase